MIEVGFKVLGSSWVMASKGSALNYLGDSKRSNKVGKMNVYVYER